MTLPRRQMMLGGGALTILMRGPAPGLAPAQIQGLPMTGRFVQGGYAFGRTWPLATVSVDGEALTTASADGLFVVGFDRDAPATVRLDARQGSQSAGQVLTIERGDFPTSRIDGLPPATVTPDDPELLARIRREATVKAAGFASRAESEHFRDGFDWPLENFRISSAWGSQRVLNGTPARPHYGVDLAAPQGTPIRAPAAGVVTLAQPDMHFEGGLVLIDHGQGLISAYLHQSRLEVREGQTLSRGDVIGLVGATGRATGPHLCWRLRWRDRNLDPSLLVRTGRAEADPLAAGAAWRIDADLIRA